MYLLFLDAIACPNTYPVSGSVIVSYFAFTKSLRACFNNFNLQSNWSLPSGQVFGLVLQRGHSIRQGAISGPHIQKSPQSDVKVTQAPNLTIFVDMEEGSVNALLPLEGCTVGHFAPVIGHSMCLASAVCSTVRQPR